MPVRANDAERQRGDPVMRHIVGGCGVDRDTVSAGQVARFETDVLCHPACRNNRRQIPAGVGNRVTSLTCA